MKTRYDVVIIGEVRQGWLLQQQLTTRGRQMF